MDSLLSGHRRPRCEVDLPEAPGLYALFLKTGTHLPGITPRPDRLLYIGKADGAGGLLRRCHFNGRTRDHSPRKSLAVLLQETLDLVPELICKPKGPPTWGLIRESDRTLSNWMHSSLELTFVALKAPRAAEKALIAAEAPPLNLTDCKQTPEHSKISATRKAVLEELKAERRAICYSTVRTDRDAGNPPHQMDYSGTTRDTAPAIAQRYNLNAKSYRARLRAMIASHERGSSWDVEKGSTLHDKMVQIAVQMQQDRQRRS